MSGADSAAVAESRRTVDRYLDGLITLVQPGSGHRAGLDAALLQALVPADAAGQAIDLGAGVGTVGFAAAARASALNVTGVEKDAELVDCGQAALAMPQNAAIASRVRLVHCDVLDPERLAEALPPDSGAPAWVLMNPPFDQAGHVRASPDHKRRAAHIGERGLLAAWCRAAAALLPRGGALGLIHRAQALAEALDALAGHYGDIRVMSVHPHANAAASRILLRATRSSRAGLRIAPGLVLHEPDGRWTETAEAILRGRSAITL